jgi:prevent-host-death family protein
MKLNLAEAKARLTDLVRRAEAGEEVVLMRHGKAVARIVSIVQRPTQEQRLAVIAAIRKRAAGRDQGGEPSDRSQDFLYGDDGLPA